MSIGDSVQKLSGANNFRSGQAKRVEKIFAPLYQNHGYVSPSQGNSGKNPTQSYTMTFTCKKRTEKKRKMDTTTADGESHKKPHHHQVSVFKLLRMFGCAWAVTIF